MAVYGYCRVSTDRQADEGESLRAQKRKIEGYAMMQDLALDNIFVEKAVSGRRGWTSGRRESFYLRSSRPVMSSSRRSWIACSAPPSTRSPYSSS